MSQQPLKGDDHDFNASDTFVQSVIIEDAVTNENTVTNENPVIYETENIIGEDSVVAEKVFSQCFKSIIEQEGINEGHVSPP